MQLPTTFSLWPHPLYSPHLQRHQNHSTHCLLPHLYYNLLLTLSISTTHWWRSSPSNVCVPNKWWLIRRMCTYIEDCSFLVANPSAWNTLSLSVQDVKTRETLTKTNLLTSFLIVLFNTAKRSSSNILFMVLFELSALHYLTLLNSLTAD